MFHFEWPSEAQSPQLEWEQVLFKASLEAYFNSLLVEKLGTVPEPVFPIDSEFEFVFPLFAQLDEDPNQPRLVQTRSTLRRSRCFGASFQREFARVAALRL